MQLSFSETFIFFLKFINDIYSAISRSTKSQNEFSAFIFPPWQQEGAVEYSTVGTNAGQTPQCPAASHGYPRWCWEECQFTGGIHSNQIISLQCWFLVHIWWLDLHVFFNERLRWKAPWHQDLMKQHSSSQLCVCSHLNNCQALWKPCRELQRAFTY